jgi:hypothetical protein
MDVAEEVMEETMRKQEEQHLKVQDQLVALQQLLEVARITLEHRS